MVVAQFGHNSATYLAEQRTQDVSLPFKASKCYFETGKHIVLISMLSKKKKKKEYLVYN
jgi:hypothetical protein